MMRSMFSSVSGLKSHQTQMDVIGNNIANVNTVGFKASRTTFSEIFAQTLSGASAPDPNSGRGGTNPVQIGLGMNVSSIDTIMGRGSLQRTDNPMDLSIEGEGFFIVGNGKDGSTFFTRAGNFKYDELGNIVTSDGLNLLGWQDYERDDEGNYIFDVQKEIKPLNLYEDEYNLNKRIIAAQVTSKAVLSGNLDATNKVIEGDAEVDNSHFIVPLTVYDDLGNEYSLNVTFWKTSVDTPGDSAETTWTYRVTSDEETGLNSAEGDIKFDSKGNIIRDASGFSIKPIIELTPGANVGADSFEFELNFEKLSMFADSSSVKPTQVDGYPPGSLTSFNIGSDGIMTGVYSNGRQQPLGMVGLAVFDNAAGLQKAGSNLFIPSTNSGDFSRALRAGTEGAGSLNPGTLEMSNVDLAQQFTQMIVTQRGFQANSRTMTASDEMLQELTNMKR